MECQVENLKLNLVFSSLLCQNLSILMFKNLIQIAYSQVLNLDEQSLSYVNISEFSEFVSLLCMIFPRSFV